MKILDELAAFYKSNLSTEDIISLLPVLLNLGNVLASKGQTELTDETIEYLQAKIEEARGKK